jgi:hypothetical protein
MSNTHLPLCGPRHWKRVPRRLSNVSRRQLTFTLPSVALLLLLLLALTPVLVLVLAMIVLVQRLFSGSHSNAGSITKTSRHMTNRKSVTMMICRHYLVAILQEGALHQHNIQSSIFNTHTHYSTTQDTIYHSRHNLPLKTLNRQQNNTLHHLIYSITSLALPSLLLLQSLSLMEVGACMSKKAWSVMLLRAIATCTTSPHRLIMAPAWVTSCHCDNIFRRGTRLRG